jgi:peptidoglycan/xylan/chitin deacetylase (PgdA/CDA1 family)
LCEKKHALLLAIMILAILLCANSYNPIINDVANIKNQHLEAVRHINTPKKFIAITFDDGPHPKYTKQILGLLKEYDAKATFFVVGKNVKNYPDVLVQEINGGHEIGNHTYSHVDTRKISKQKLEKEIDLAENIIFETANIKPTLIRPPYGFYDQKLLDIASKKNYRVILWSRDSHDWSCPEAKKIYNKILDNIQNGDIVLLHDYVEKTGTSPTVEALKVFLPELSR